MSIYQVVSGWFQNLGPAPSKLDGTRADREHNVSFGEGGTHAEKRVTANTTMSLSAAWSCVRLNAKTIGSLPFKLYVREDAHRRTIADQHPLYRVINDRPNPDQGAMEYWEGQIAALNLRGNSYSRIGRRGDQQVVALWPLSPDTVSPYRTPVGERRYRLATGEDLPSSEIFHLRGFGAGGDLGLSPIAYGRQTIATALAAEEVAGKTFANGLQLGGFVEDQPGAKTTIEQREGLARLFEKFAGSSRAGKVMPLPPGMRFQPLGLSPEDAQLLDTRRFTVEEICRWFGVFPILIGHAAQGQTMWGSGIEQLMLAWLTLGLGPELTRIEEAVRCQLILPAEQPKLYAEHVVEGLLRADSQGRAALYSALGQNGVMYRSEMRAKENLPPDDSPNADKLTVQSNLVLLDQLGAAASPNAPADQLRSAMMNLLFGGDIETMIAARVKAATTEQSGPRRGMQNDAAHQE